MVGREPFDSNGNTQTWRPVRQPGRWFEIDEHDKESASPATLAHSLPDRSLSSRVSLKQVLSSHSSTTPSCRPPCSSALPQIQTMRHPKTVPGRPRTRGARPAQRQQQSQRLLVNFGFLGSRSTVTRESGRGDPSGGTLLQCKRHDRHSHNSRYQSHVVKLALKNLRSRASQNPCLLRKRSSRGALYWLPCSPSASRSRNLSKTSSRAPWRLPQ